MCSEHAKGEEMRCMACDCLLSDSEDVCKYHGTNVDIGLCYKCQREAGISTQGEVDDVVSSEDTWESEGGNVNYN